MSKNNNPPAKTDLNKNHLKEEFVKKFLENQENDIKLRAQEIELRKQADNNNYEYAKKSLDVQAKDMEASRNATLKFRTQQYIFSSFVLLVILIFLGIALYLGKDQIVIEIIKAVIFLGVGGIGGYSYGRTEKKDK